MRPHRPCATDRLISSAIHDQRDKRSDAAARFSDFECPAWQLQHIPFPKDRYAGQVNDGFTGARRQQLQWKSNLIENNRGKRNHQKKKSNWECQRPEVLPAPDVQHGACNDTDKGDAGEKELNTEQAADQNRETDTNQNEPEDAGLTTRGLQGAATLPAEVQRQRHDEKSMEEGVPIEHKMVTNAIARAQKQVEAQNFAVRKHLLEYDDVMNKQRESIYSLRRELLEGKIHLTDEDTVDTREYLMTLAEELIDSTVDTYAGQEVDPEDRDFGAMTQAVADIFGMTAAWQP